jgi:hypothetical protein
MDQKMVGMKISGYKPEERIKARSSNFRWMENVMNDLCELKVMRCRQKENNREE